MFFPVLIAALLAPASGLSVESCARNYEKIGCYKEYHPQSEDLVVYDRFGIKWNDFDNYLHKLTCSCESQVRRVNKIKGESEKYTGFALHFWAECYGKTQRQIDALVGQPNSKACTGDSTFKGCSASNKECTGHAFTDFVFKLKPIEDELQIFKHCEKTPLSFSCPEGLQIRVQNASYGERTATQCGAPLSKGWKESCSRMTKLRLTSYVMFCDTKPKCDIKSWYVDNNDPCKDVEKYFQIEYKCVKNED